MNKEKTQIPKSQFIRLCLGILFLLLIAGFFLSKVIDILDSVSSPGSQFESGKADDAEDKEYPYEDLELLSAEVRNLSITDEWKNGSLAASVPELKDVALLQGYQLYQFDVKLRNKGNDQSYYDGSVYIMSDENAVIPHFAPYTEGDQTDDTRILPPGREAVVTVYAEVKDGTKEVYAETYNTKNSKSVKMPIEME